MNQKKLIETINNMPSLSDVERETILSVLTSGSPWYFKVLRIVKILGAIAGYILAGVGLSSCTNFLIN